MVDENKEIVAAKRIAAVLLNRRTKETGTRKQLSESIDDLKNNDKENKYKEVAGLFDFIQSEGKKNEGFATVSWLQAHLNDQYVEHMETLTDLLEQDPKSDLQEILFLGVLKEIAESAGSSTVKNVENRKKMIVVLNHMVDKSSLFSADTKESLKTSIKKCEPKPMAAEELGPLYKQVIESMAKVECSKELTNNFPQKQKHRKGGSEKQKAAVNAAVEKGFTAVKPKQTTGQRPDVIGAAAEAAKAAKAAEAAEAAINDKKPKEPEEPEEPKAKRFSH